MSDIPVIPKWGKKVEPPRPRTDPSFIGVRNEAVRDDSGKEAHITIRTGDSEDNEYKVEYVEGQALSRYLGRLRLKRRAAYSAVYDRTNLENGRCRMTYVPGPGAVITIGSASVGTATGFQRSRHDAEALARNMGGGADVVEGSMAYGRPKK
jgi:hypothetical protein